MWLKRASVLVSVLALAAGNAGLCAGWAPTPQARMACCTGGAGCPMHAASAGHHGAGHTITQSEADGCCAASNGGRSSQPGPFIAAGISPAVLTAVVPAAPVTLARSVRLALITVPIPAPVPRHLLLSVFLV
jgi:hypothetical protein